MPEKSWLIVWDQSGKASVHSGWLLKFMEMSSISESEINALRARFHAVAAPLAPSVPPMIHTVNAAVPLQPIQQVPPVAGPVHLNPQAVLPDEDS